MTKKPNLAKVSAILGRALIPQPKKRKAVPKSPAPRTFYKYDVILYNDSGNEGETGSITFSGYVAESKEKAREYGNRQARIFFAHERVSVHVIWRAS